MRSPALALTLVLALVLLAGAAGAQTGTPGGAALASLVLERLGLQPGDLWDPVLGAAIRARLEARPDIDAVTFAGRAVGGGGGRELIVRVVILGVLAGIVAAVVNYLTLQESVRRTRLEGLT